MRSAACPGRPLERFGHSLDASSANAVAPRIAGEAVELSEPVKLWPEHTMQTVCGAMAGNRTFGMPAQFLGQR